ncbi:MAG TPA: CoA pyrophosphatase [Actinomycetota bacterium]|nr:CoA pyrophosphatase [Actinomycetota bacterium]
MTDSFKESLKADLQARPGRHLIDDSARDAAVLIPIIGGENPSLIFTVRTETLPSHKGQISFPGGSIDLGDESSEAAALREAHEEIGLDPNSVEVLGRLDSMHTFVSGYVVTPVIGWIEEQPELKPNEAEVAQILQIPLADLAEEIRSEPGFENQGRTLPTEAWIWDDQVIWGVTAKIVRTFLERLAEIGLGEAPGETSTPWPEISRTPR